jgi:NADPH:quinone reductase-like Zn-dependent oxidoreductase
MKAAIIREHGDIAKLQVDDIPDPAPGPGEVLIEVRAAALNHLDIWVRKGRPGVEIPFPHVLGSDASGVVLDTGENVTGWRQGDEIILNPGLWDERGEYSLRGEQNVDPSFGIIGFMRPGTFAEKVSVPDYCVACKPEHLSFTEAAALPLDHLTAWRMLMTRAQARAGETVLIHGIGGGAALAGLQIAKLAGLEAIVTSSSDEKLERAKELGADHTINYRKAEKIHEVVREITGGRGVDIAFDSVGAATWPVNMQAVRRGGRVVHCGVTSGAQVEANISAIYWNQLSILGSTMGSAEDFRQMLSAVHIAGLKPQIDSVHPLEQARQAMQRMENGEQFGKIVLEIA